MLRFAMKNLRGLYFIADPAFCKHLSITDVVHQAAANGAAIIQLRDKTSALNEIKEISIALLKILKPLHIPLIINDHPQIAIAIGADGVHLGQKDFSSISEVIELRSKLGIIGITVNNNSHLEIANLLPIDYIGLGPIFQTTSKENPAPVWGTEKLKNACLQSKHPVFAIGGITKDNAHETMRSGTSGLAVLSAISADIDPGLRAKELSAIISENLLTEQKIINHSISSTETKLVGIGDDCAVIPTDNNNSLLISTDTLAEDIHFIRSKIPAYKLGIKALRVNLSDIAAMGGTAKNIFLSVSLPPNISACWYEEFIAGLKEEAARHNINILGGDTTASAGKIFINITITGESHPDKIIFRHTAKPGDSIFVTGNLGDSAAGLMVQEKNIDNNTLLNAHYLPPVRLNEASFLANAGISSMMDLSDGLLSDLKKLITASACGAELNLRALPVSEELTALSKDHNFDAQELALTGGEDYELLFTVTADKKENLKKDFTQHFSTKLTEIGKITSGNNFLVLDGNNNYIPRIKIFEHF